MPDLTPQGAIVAAARRLLRPLVRQLVHHGVTFPAINKLLKQLFVEVAAEEFRLPRRKLSDSRVALITGIPRKEVAVLRERGSGPEELPLDTHMATRLLGRWTGDPRYLTPDGEPQVLPFESRDDTPSFSELVRKVGGDIPARAVLDELVRVGAAAVSAERDVSLLARRYIPAKGTVEKIHMLGEDTAEFISTISHNILSPPDDLRFQQKIEFDNIGSRGVPTLERHLRRLADAFLTRVTNLMASYDRDRNANAPGGTRMRVVMGAYYFEQQRPEKDDSRDGGGSGTER
jgi:hypothetical protein